MPSAADILNYCVDLDTNNDPALGDCNAFLKKVAQHFGVQTGPIDDLNADGIVSAFSAAPFTKKTQDPILAMSWAHDAFVVAGMKSAELQPYNTADNLHPDGHVAIVHDHPDSDDPNHTTDPAASWGQKGGRGDTDTTIRQSFPHKACDDRAVHFFAFA
jgi:hypothetical protein